uniref:Uncharacterized protein n=1 Tax=Schizaphis graminum TaxID=13262 RepID=A0A2S2PMT7_SCHGA
MITDRDLFGDIARAFIILLCCASRFSLVPPSLPPADKLRACTRVTVGNGKRGRQIPKRIGKKNTKFVCRKTRRVHARAVFELRRNRSLEVTDYTNYKVTLKFEKNLLFPLIGISKGCSERTSVDRSIYEFHYLNTHKKFYSRDRFILKISSKSIKLNNN